MLISVNPFRDLGIYTEAVLDSYRGRNRLEVIALFTFVLIEDVSSCFRHCRVLVLQYEELQG